MQQLVVLDTRGSGGGGGGAQNIGSYGEILLLQVEQDKLFIDF
jgi:hypothetical protein